MKFQTNIINRTRHYRSWT